MQLIAVDLILSLTFSFLWQHFFWQQNLGNVFPVNGEPAQGLPANAAYVCTLLYGGVIFVILVVLAVVCGCSYLDNAVNNPNSELNRGKSGGDSEPSTSTSGTRKKKKKQTLKSAANKSAASRFSRRCCRRRRRRSASRLQFEQWYRF